MKLTTSNPLMPQKLDIKYKIGQIKLCTGIDLHKLSKNLSHMIIVLRDK
jgi:hypothetical protein